MKKYFKSLKNQKNQTCYNHIKVGFPGKFRIIKYYLVWLFSAFRKTTSGVLSSPSNEDKIYTKSASLILKMKWTVENTSTNSTSTAEITAFVCNSFHISKIFLLKCSSDSISNTGILHLGKKSCWKSGFLKSVFYLYIDDFKQVFALWAAGKCNVQNHFNEVWRRRWTKQPLDNSKWTLNFSVFLDVRNWITKFSHFMISYSHMKAKKSEVNFIITKYFW